MARTLIKLTPIALALMLAGCGTVGNAVRSFDDPVVVKPQLKSEPKLAEPATGAITVAVYNFRDMTGQRKASQMIASLSSAVTQGADAYLVKSLQEVGGGKWFKVLERGGLDNLVKERQLIRQMRELYQGKDAQPLPPMMFAGMLIEGGIIGYDSNTMSGGSGARLLGIGASTEYRQDEVVVSLRAVSVATGEVLVSITTSKTVLSFQDKAGVLRFYDAGTRSLELETGAATNESMNKAVQLAIHAAVIEMINEGAKKGHWSFKPEPVVVKPAPIEEKKEPAVEKPAEPKKEEKVGAAPAESPAPVVAPQPVLSGDGQPIRFGHQDINVESPKAEEKSVKRTATAIGKSNIRETLKSGATIVAVLEPGETVTVHDEKFGLLLIETKRGRKGWIDKTTVK